MNKQSQKILFLWMLIAGVVAGGVFLLCEHHGAGTGVVPSPVSASRPDVDVRVDNATVGATPVAMQQFSSNAYSFSVPARWRIEQTGTDTVAVYSDIPSGITCKIEVSAFPYVPGEDTADWISRRIGADPSLSVSERSSENVALANGSALQWTGTINDIPTVLVYAFNTSHAYEIAPSVVGEGAGGSAPCEGVLTTFLSGSTI